MDHFCLLGSKLRTTSQWIDLYKNALQGAFCIAFPLNKTIIWCSCSSLGNNHVARYFFSARVGINILRCWLVRSRTRFVRKIYYFAGLIAQLDCFPRCRNRSRDIVLQIGSDRIWWVIRGPRHAHLPVVLLLAWELALCEKTRTAHPVISLLFARIFFVEFLGIYGSVGEEK